MAEPEFERLQRAFARHLRDPENVPFAGPVDERRLAVYRHAVFANIETFMKDNYPRVRDVMDEARWRTMLRHYIRTHESRTSIFTDLPLEFLAYLEHERNDPQDPPFLYELAHFDWLETLVGIDERRVDLEGVDPSGDPLTGIPVPNPVLRMVTYRFPVHVINAGFMPTEPPPQPTRIAAFRDRDNLYGFLDLNGPSARLLELAVEGGRTGHDMLVTIARELARDDLSALLAAGGTILARMVARGAILGTRTG